MPVRPENLKGCFVEHVQSIIRNDPDGVVFTRYALMRNGWTVFYNRPACLLAMLGDDGGSDAVFFANAVDAAGDLRTDEVEFWLDLMRMGGWDVRWTWPERWAELFAKLNRDEAGGGKAA